MKIEIFARRGLWGKRWMFRVKAANGEVIAHGEAYQNRADCVETVRLLRGGLFDAEIVNL